MAIQLFSINGTGGGGGGGSTVNTSNGIQGDGSAGSPVRQGGAFAGVTFLNVPPTAFVEYTLSDAAGNFAHINIGGGANVYFDANNQGDVPLTPDTAINGIQVTSGDVINQISNSTNTFQKQGLTFINHDSGLIEDDANNIGIKGKDLFPATNSKQYAQYGNIAANVASVNVPGGNATQSLTYVVGSTYEFLRINQWALFQSGAGSLDIAIDYVDNAGNPHTISQGSLDLFNPVNIPNPYLIQAQAASNVVLTWSVTGVVVYDRIATIEKLL